MRPDGDDDERRRAKTFTATLVSLVAAAVLVSVLVTPAAAVVVSRLGFHFPFSRIFDRVAMAAIGAALLWQRRRLKLGARLERGFARPRLNFAKMLRGLIAGIAGVAMLWLLAALQSPPKMVGLRGLVLHAPAALATGLAVGVIEEGFFRAFLLDGLQQEFGATPALVASAAVYAAAHLVRPQARAQISRLDMGAGLRNLEGALRGLMALRALAGFIGLFLLGLVLGLAFQRTRTAYFSTGFHAGLVFAAKSWRYAASAPENVARWIGGYGWPPLVSGAAAWIMLTAVLLLLGPLSGTPRRRQSS